MGSCHAKAVLLFNCFRIYSLIVQFTAPFAFHKHSLAGALTGESGHILMCSHPGGKILGSSNDNATAALENAFPFCQVLFYSNLHLCHTRAITMQVYMIKNKYVMLKYCVFLRYVGHYIYIVPYVWLQSLHISSLLLICRLQIHILRREAQSPNLTHNLKYLL